MGYAYDGFIFVSIAWWNGQRWFRLARQYRHLQNTRPSVQAITFYHIRPYDRKFCLQPTHLRYLSLGRPNQRRFLLRSCCLIGPLFLRRTLLSYFKKFFLRLSKPTVLRNENSAHSFLKWATSVITASAVKTVFFSLRRFLANLSKFYARFFPLFLLLDKAHRLLRATLTSLHLRRRGRVSQVYRHLHLFCRRSDYNFFCCTIAVLGFEIQFVINSSTVGGLSAFSYSSLNLFLPFSIRAKVTLFVKFYLVQDGYNASGSSADFKIDLTWVAFVGALTLLVKGNYSSLLSNTWFS